MLLRAEQRRSNLHAAQFAWLVTMLQQVIPVAVNQGYAAAKGAELTIRPFEWKELVRSVPGYVGEEE